MQTRLFLACLGIAAGCYEPPATPCTIACSETSGCPGDQVCVEGLCRGAEDTCVLAPLEWSALSVGATFACAITTEGHLYCWGNHRRGQLGVGPRIDELAAPRRVGTGCTHISAGAEHACGLRDGKALCWGYNADGQVRGEKGSEFTEPQTVVVQIGDEPPLFDQISAGSKHTCAIGQGQLWCWGSTVQVGLANVVATRIGMADDWQIVSAGHDHTCAISAGQGLHCWGENTVGQVNEPANLGPIAEPIPVAVNGLTVLAVSAGDQTTCAIAGAPGAAAGELWCWGRNGAQQIDATRVNTGTPTRVGALSGWSEIAVGHDLVCGINDGLVRCWGDGDVGSLGAGLWSSEYDESMAKAILPAERVSLGKRGFANSVNDTATFTKFACALAGTKISCWGDNQLGQLALGAPSARRTPVLVEPPIDAVWTAVWAGNEHTCAMTSTNELRCWGADFDGQISAGIPRGVTQPCVADQPCDYPRPTPPPPEITRVDDLVLGRDHTCARDDSVIRCWGRSGLGAAPTGGIALPRAPMASVWTKMWGGRSGTCGRTAQGSFACWGNIAGSNLNTPTTQNSTELQDIDDVRVGDGVLCAHRGGDLARVCWGTNGEGMVGNGTNLAQSMPQALDVGTIASVALGSRHACAVTTAGNVTCWGLNNDGQCGANGSPVLSPSPVMDPVGMLGGCTRVATGLRHSCAICDGVVQCWGFDNDGALGREDTSSTTSRIARPITSTGEQFTELAARSTGTCALTVDGKLYCWGTGTYGGNGDGGQARNLPTPIVPR